MRNPNAIINDYMLEASIIPYFSNVMLKNELRSVAKDAIQTTIASKVVEEMIYQESTTLIEQTIQEAFEEERRKESKLAFKMDAE